MAGIETGAGNVPWHTLAAEEAASRLDSGPRGLTEEEARSRVERYGRNALAPAPPPTLLSVLLEQFKSPLIFILAGAAAITFALREYLDAGIIAAILALNAVIGTAQQRRAEASVRALMTLISPRARVVRDGHEWEIPSELLVPGDVVLLESGMRVAADLRLASSNNLRIDESLLTGESLAVAKTYEPLGDPETPLADRINIAHAGSTVTSGRGRGFVIATGMATELGAIASELRTRDVPDTPLQRRMARAGRVISFAVGASAAVAFLLGVARGESVTEMFTVAVALAVSAIPEGLPIAFTITLALGVRRMAGRNAIVRRLPAVETLGSTTVIGSDKTGTLTENRMAVREIWTAGGLYRVDGDALVRSDGRAEASPLVEHPPLYLTLLTGVLTNEAELFRTEDAWQSTGDPTEAALLLAAAEAGIELEDARREYRLELDLPFESERQYSASFRARAGERQVFVKGAPERVISMSNHLLSDEGVLPVPIVAIHEAADQMAGRGLRVLAMACGEAAEPLGPELTPGPLTFLGLQGLLDPPRAGVRDAIRGCREAGIRVVMITGDHATTAVAIANELELRTETDSILTGTDLDGMGDDELDARLRETSVFARVAPHQKLRIVSAFRRQGEVVAVTGDGVNDAPALRAADIGIAMGKGGTDVAREAADMVLADDNFVTIYAAVEEGRVTFDNIRKVTFFLLSTGAAEVIAVLCAVALGWPVPMLAAQLLWLNLVTNGFQDVALAFEPGERGVAHRPPRMPSEGLLSRVLWERVLVSGAVMAAGTLALFRWEMGQSDSLVQAQTVALTTMVLFQVVHVGNSRSESLSAFAKSPLSNPFLFIATAVALAVHVVALYLPPTQYVLRVEALDLGAWLRMGVVALTVLTAVEVHKRLRPVLSTPCR